ncbi:MAG: hypothetical protein LBV62_00525 [Rickettsiales bacterium]|nr:hypothetical protein [Rickettsiales bacterium]
MLYLPWVTSSIFFVFVEFTLLSCLFYSLFNPELAFQGFDVLLQLHVLFDF